MADLNIEELFNTQTSPEQIKASFDKMIAHTGRYTFAATKVEPRTGESDHVFPPVRDRQYVSLFGKLTEDVDGTTKRRGSVGFDASWEMRNGSNDKPDKPSKLWGQIVVALDMKEKSVGEVLGALKQYPIRVYVNESYKTADGWKTARTLEESRDYRKQGLEPRNFVESVSRI